jgi:2-phosphosulfolactate phosphatase
MRFLRASLETCGTAAGVVVVIDVLRAFSTAAYAFAAGARDITLVSTVEEALALRERAPELRLMGEANGLRIPGFDFSNSPADVAAADLRGASLVQRTSAGTQGVVRSRRAGRILAASFCVARATVRYLERMAPDQVTFVITGLRPGSTRPEGRGTYGDEDLACAEYLEALLSEQDPDPAPYLERVAESGPAELFLDPAHPEYAAADLEMCLALDRFDFALPVARAGGQLRMTPEPRPSVR